MSETPEQVEAFNEIQSYLIDATAVLFEGYECAVTHVASSRSAPQQTGETIAAIIGYSSDSVRGALVLMTDREQIAALHPEDMRAELSANLDALCDILGEFANMLLGRLKNQLLARGLVLMLATPTTAAGKEFRLSSGGDAMSLWHEFATSAGHVHVRFDATFEAGFSLGVEDAAPASPAVSEGDMMMF